MVDRPQPNPVCDADAIRTIAYEHAAAAAREFAAVMHLAGVELIPEALTLVTDTLSLIHI